MISLTGPLSVNFIRLVPVLFVTCIKRDSFFLIFIVVIQVCCRSGEIVLGHFSCVGLLILVLMVAGEIVAMLMLLTHHFLVISDDLEVLRHLVSIDLGLRVDHEGLVGLLLRSELLFRENLLLLLFRQPFCNALRSDTSVDKLLLLAKLRI